MCGCVVCGGGGGGWRRGAGGVGGVMNPAAVSSHTMSM